MLAFSFSLPATRVAVEELDATFVGLGRALVAAVLAGALLAHPARAVPDRRDLPRFALVGLGVVIGFPLLSSLALKQTLVGARQRRRRAAAGRDRGLGRRCAPASARPRRSGSPPPPACVAVLAFAATQGVDGHRRRRPAGARRGRAGRARVRRGRRAVAPLRRLAGDLLGAGPHRAGAGRAGRALDCAAALHAGATAWLGFAYVAVVSMFLGFFAWYHGLALGGVAKIGQMQLAQPVLTLALGAR